MPANSTTKRLEMLVSFLISGGHVFHCLSSSCRDPGVHTKRRGLSSEDLGDLVPIPIHRTPVRLVWRVPVHQMPSECPPNGHSTSDELRMASVLAMASNQPSDVMRCPSSN